MPPQERKRRLRRIVLGVGIALLVVVGAATAYMASRQEGDVTNPDVEFRDEPDATPEPEEETEKPRNKRADPADRFVWAQYGYTRDRRRYLPLERPLRPPFKPIWEYEGNVLLEFPPVIARKKLYLLNDAGKLFAINKHNGKVLWKRKLGALAAASPAYADGTLYVAVLQRSLEGAGANAGRIVALDADSGKRKWARALASRTESSPVVDGNRVYFGSENGTVYAMNTRDGGVVWSFRAAGAVKGGLALADGKLYFGDYGGRVYAIRQAGGGLLWRTSTHGRSFGRGGNFYSTPAVAYGRVYIGNTDGRMYSLGADTGRIAWSRSTGGYVYASPAVAKVPGGDPLVYAGSYSGVFYAWDARTGDLRWSRGGNGRISGGATVIGDVVFFADLGKRDVIGLGARTGRKVFEHPHGSYNPVVSDGETIYLVGYHNLYALQSLSHTEKKARARTARRRVQRIREDRRICTKRARSWHPHNRRARLRSVSRCVERRRDAHRTASRAECLKLAKKAHKGKKNKIRRSYRTCVKRRGVQRR